MKKVAFFLLIWLGAALATAIAAPIPIALWSLYLSGHGKSSWLLEEREYSLIGPSSPMNIILVLGSLALGAAVAAWLVKRVGGTKGQ